MAVNNENIASIFEEIADLLEIDEANPFRVRAYRNAARTIRGLSRELREMVDEGRDLTKLPGIGKDLSAKIREILASGHTAALDKLHKEIPASVEELLNLPGLGPRRVKQLYHELGIENLSQLERAARSGKVSSLPGFAGKTEQNILDNIHALRSKEKRFLRNTAAENAEPLLQYLEKNKNVKKAVIAGSYRRSKDTVGDLDILVTAVNPATVIDHFSRYEEVAQIVSSGETRSTVILHSGLQVDLRVVAEKNFGSALYYFTGSKAHNIKVRRLARRQGLKINEYGVYRENKRIAGKSEESVFEAVGLPFIPAELREDRGEIKAALDGKLPVLVQTNDIRGDLHTHSVAAGGRNTVKDMAMAARKYGLEYLAITDHSGSTAAANGMEPEQLSRQIDEIDRLNSSLKGITILRGIEVEIHEDGTLDLPDNILSRLDLVIAAVHSDFQLPRKKQTERILRAMDNRYLSILAHPSCRLLLERSALDIDMEKIINKAADRGCFLELNSQPGRLDLTDIYCQMACSAGVLVCINSDARNIDEFKYLMYGAGQARRGWMEKHNVLNTRPLKSLKKLLSGTMA